MKALELANKALGHCDSECLDDIAAELRRLAEVNAELLEALAMCSVAFDYAEKCTAAVDAAISKATGGAK